MIKPLMIDVDTRKGKWVQESVNLSDTLEKMEIIGEGQDIEKEKFADFMMIVYPACLKKGMTAPQVKQPQVAK